MDGHDDLHRQGQHDLLVFQTVENRLHLGAGFAQMHRHPVHRRVAMPLQPLRGLGGDEAGDRLRVLQGRHRPLSLRMAHAVYGRVPVLAGRRGFRG